MSNETATTEKKDGRSRKCVGCHQDVALVDLKTACERFTIVEVDGSFSLLFDPFGKLPGRGCYVHPKKACLKNACRSGFFASFKKKRELFPLPPFDEIVAGMQKGIRRRFMETIRASYKSQDAFVGEMSVSQAMKEEQVRLLLIVSDAGASTKRKYQLNAERKKIVTTEMIDREHLGQLLGRDAPALIGFGGQLANKLIEDIRKLETLGF